MNISAPFINRPVATTLLTLAVGLLGLIAFYQLPVAPLPQVDFPTISVSASLPGASPETMAATVATPLERSLGRIAGITEMTSSSSLGSTRVTLQFDMNRDIDGAARDVQAAINAASSLLPAGLPSKPSYRKVNPADSPILVLSLTSESLSRGEVYDAASTILTQKIAKIQGVGQVSVGGSSLPAVRIELNPHSLGKYGIGLEEVRTAVTSSNQNRPKGTLDASGKQWTINANDQLKTAADYLPLIVSYKNGSAVRLSDLGRVENSVEDIRNAGIHNGKPSVLLILNRQPGANIIETAERIKKELPALRDYIPKAINMSVVVDRSISIRSSVDEVEKSLLIAILLVILIVYVFLRDARSTLIPSITVPVSLLGTFGIMYLLDYSLNNLSLMALTIATGFVVDDAIVVLENTSRHIEAGENPIKAALIGAKEVGFTVLSMSLSLIAVFIPILLMGGIVGRLFREFAVTLSVAVLVSMVLSLTTTAMLCARWLRVKQPSEKNKPRGFYPLLLNAYRISLDWSLNHGLFMIIVLIGMIALNVHLYGIIPKGFFPIQDGGRLVGSIQADQGISFQAMQKKLADFVEIVKDDPDIENVIGFTGGQQMANSGLMFAVLKKLEERTSPLDSIMARLRANLGKEAGASLYLQPAQDIRVGGRPSAALFEYTLQSDNLEELRTWTPKIVKALSASSELVDVNTDQQDKGRKVNIKIDKSTMSRLGITQQQLDSALNNAFGQRQVSVIYNPLNQYRVVMELAPEYAENPDTLKALYIHAPPDTQHPEGINVPLSAIASFDMINIPLVVNHQSQFAAATISFNLNPGSSLSSATKAIDEAMATIGVPESIHGGFQGTAKVFKESLSNQPFLILGALVTIYIVLGILYESFIHPITILSTLPSAGVGALLALMLFNSEFSIIAMIGVILLIGIVKKNAIMMIDFALHAERHLGLNSKEAIHAACLLRFRPILMTTCAALLGALPLALGTGYGAELRRPLGISIVGGLIASQILTLYTTPVVYLYLDEFRNWVNRKRHKPA